MQESKLSILNDISAYVINEVSPAAEVNSSHN